MLMDVCLKLIHLWMCFTSALLFFHIASAYLLAHAFAP